MDFIIEANDNDINGKIQRKIINVVNNNISFYRLGLTKEQRKQCYDAAIKKFYDNGGDFNAGWIKEVVSAANYPEFLTGEI